MFESHQRLELCHVLQDVIPYGVEFASDLPSFYQQMYPERIFCPFVAILPPFLGVFSRSLVSPLL